MKITADPKSDQWNADDFIGGPRTFTIAGVKVGTAEQKYDVELVEGEGRVWRPPLTMLRLLISAWSDEAAQWTGRRVTLYRDESIKFGPDAVGGIRISHMSHLPGNKPLTTMLTSTRGRRARHTVEPLPDAPAPITPEQVAEFERRIADAVTLEQLDAVAKDLKACDLGSHRKALQAAWSDRSVAIKSAATPAPEQATLTEVEDVTDEQIQDLAMAREERFGATNTAKSDWTAWVAETIGREFAGNDNALTRDEADDLLALLAAKDGAQ